MENDNQQKKNDSVFSKKIKAGRRRTYFFDIKTTKANDYYLTITESKKKPNQEGYERHKIFLYKEDFNKFIEAINETINHVKTELMPDYDFDEFDRKQEEYYRMKAAEGGADHHAENDHEEESHDEQPQPPVEAKQPSQPSPKPTEGGETGHSEDVDSW